MFEHSPSDRMQVVGIGDLLHPGSCFLCGSGNNDEGYLNFNVFVDMHGSLYLCMTCIRQAAEVINCLLPEEAQHLKEHAAEIAETNSKLVAKLEVANERLNAFDAVLSGIPGLAALVNAGVADPASSEEPAVTGTPANDADGGESEPSEPVKGSGRDDSNGPTASNRKPRKSTISL